MLTVKGDLMVVTDGVRGIPTNGIVKADGDAVMGAGLAKTVATAHPWIPAKLGALIEQHGNRPFNLGRGWVSVPTKDHWKDPSDLELIESSCHHLVTMADKFEWRRVYLPKLGCGLGGLEWPQVAKVMSPILDTRFRVLR